MKMYFFGLFDKIYGFANENLALKVYVTNFKLILNINSYFTIKKSIY
jgi:hypothetical protein